MIETQEALDNLDDILSTPGLDAVYVGPSDLAISLGEDPDAMARAPKVVAAIEGILEKAQKHSVIPCIHTGSGEMAKEYLAKGWRLTTIQNDLRLMLAGTRQALAAARARTSSRFGLYGGSPARSLGLCAVGLPVRTGSIPSSLAAAGELADQSKSERAILDHADECGRVALVGTVSARSPSSVMSCLHGTTRT